MPFSLDCYGREPMAYVATTGSSTGDLVRDLMAQTFEHRFGAGARQGPHAIEWLWDNGPPYTAYETCEFGRSLGLLIRTTPAYSPESNGMAEAFVKGFKRDRVNVRRLESDESVLARLPGWMLDYNTITRTRVWACSRQQSTDSCGLTASRVGTLERPRTGEVMNLERRELAVFLEVRRHVAMEDAAQVYEYRSDSGTGLRVVAAPLAADPTLQVVFSLGSRSPHLFITVTDGEPQEIAGVVGNLEQFDVPPKLGHGHTVPTESKYLAEHGRVGLVLLRPKVSNALDKMPDHLEVEGGRLHCLLVLFLSPKELTLKRNEGLDRLLDYFEEVGRDVVELQA